MRIARLTLVNFKKYARFELELHPSLTLLVGENGAGKTSVLDGLAVALGVWLVNPPDSSLVGMQRPIDPSEIRLTGNLLGDRTLFQEAADGVSVSATGQLLGSNSATWTRKINEGGKRTVNTDAKDVCDMIADAYVRAKNGDHEILPVIAYYGAGRSWLAHRERKSKPTKGNEPANRWAAFYDCLNDRIRLSDLNMWFRDEAIAAVNRRGEYRPGFSAVRKAVLQCVPDADGLWYDGDRKEIVLSIGGLATPFDNLSAGQRTILALVADIAVKCVTQNSHLLGASEAARPEAVLDTTPGVVLIDEVDVHLHPKWQRRILRDLQGTFPKIQFVCTTHSPQVIGEAKPEQIRLLTDQIAEVPAQSFGMDANWILATLMDSAERDPETAHQLENVFSLISERNLAEAQAKVAELRARIGVDGELQRAASTIERMRMLGG